MADFVQTMKDWRRMCQITHNRNRNMPGSLCTDCPVAIKCFVDSCLKDTTDAEIKKMEEDVQNWTAENPEPVYPAWWEWLVKQGILVADDTHANMRYWYAVNREMIEKPIPADIAEKLGLKPKGGA